MRSSPIRRSSRSSPLTYELGARGKLPLGTSSSGAWSFFRTDVQDDIQFIVVETGGGGFFQNIAQTRRQGIEVGLQGAWKRLKYYLSYAYIDATYQTNVTLASVTAPDGVQGQGQAIASPASP